MASPVQLLVGLGNPGPQYAGTRHNAGFALLDDIAGLGAAVTRFEARFHGDVARVNLAGEQAWLLKPMSFMNRSGESVAALATYYRIEPESILVLHDELDLPTGQIRLKRGGGHGGHNGLRDIISHLGSAGFLRLRIGIDRPPAGGDVTGYVLGQPGVIQRQEMEQAWVRFLPLLPDLLAGRIERAMQTLHTET
ncbi:MAG: aminoacyl-tRNA hydrolase [Gammaproteobacteria bacterium]|nr:aminoacyl-tRNA hydrolase [Gammaproteobacteria bacterium]